MCICGIAYHYMTVNYTVVTLGIARKASKHRDNPIIVGKYVSCSGDSLSHG